MKNSLKLILLICIIFVCGLPHLTANTKDSLHLKTLRLQLKWKHQFQFAGYYTAIEKGFYKDLGLNVILTEAVEGKEPAQAVFDGTADFGISTSDIVLMRSDGMKAVVLASIFQHSAQILVASKESGINHIHDLKGKRIDLEPHAADLITFMSDEGIKPMDFIATDHSFDVSRLLNGEVDAMTAYSTDEPFVLQQNNFEYTIISPSMGGIDFYGDVLFTNEELIISDPELVKNFVEASIKGWKYALENQDEIIELIFTKYSQRHSKEHLKFEAEKMMKLIMPDVVEIGYSNPGRWQNIVDIYIKTGLIESKNVLNGLLYSDFKKQDTPINWRNTLIAICIGLALASLAAFFYYNNQRLKSEMQKRKETESELQKHQEHLEELVKERTKELEEKNEELERYNKLFVGREFRMKELKDKVAELEQKLKNK